MVEILGKEEFERFRKLKKEAVNRGSKIVKRQGQRATFYDLAEYQKERWNRTFEEIYQEFKEIEERR